LKGKCPCSITGGAYGDKEEADGSTWTLGALARQRSLVDPLSRHRWETAPREGRTKE
jgi:hypothetical protein